MANKQTVKRSLEEKIINYSGYQNAVPGWIGATPSLISAGIGGLIYVRLVNGQIVIAINTIAPEVFDYPVIVARSKTNRKLWEVVSLREVYGVPLGGNLVKFHHEQHEYPSPDTVWIKDAQFLPFLILPDGGFTVKLYGGIASQAGNRYVVSNQTINLEGYVPAEGAVWALIQILDGIIDIVVSDVFGSKEVLEPSNIPTGEGIELCAVRLYSLQEQLERNVVNNDFVDLRFGRGGNIAFDENAIHLNAANEFSVVSQKTLHPDDIFIIEDSQDNFSKKRTKVVIPVVGKYRQFTYTVSGGDFSFIIDHNGNPVMALQSLEQ
jgi:hypothetical protein